MKNSLVKTKVGMVPGLNSYWKPLHIEIVEDKAKPGKASALFVANEESRCAIYLPFFISVKCDLPIIFFEGQDLDICKTNLDWLLRHHGQQFVIEMVELLKLNGMGL